MSEVMQYGMHPKQATKQANAAIPCVNPPLSGVVTVMFLRPQLGHRTGALWLCSIWSGTQPMFI